VVEWLGRSAPDQRIRGPCRTRSLYMFCFFTEVRGECRKQFCLSWLPCAVDFKVSCSHIPRRAFTGIRTHYPLVESLDILTIRPRRSTCSLVSAARLVYQRSSGVWIACDSFMHLKKTLGSFEKSRGISPVSGFRGISPVSDFQFCPKSESLGLNGTQPQWE
jgi:hypothetical protein